MADTGSTVDPTSAALFEKVARRYGVRPLRLVHRLAGGYANDVLLVETGRERLVLRVERAPLEVESIAWEHEVTLRLAERVPEVPAPREAPDGSTFFVHDGQAISLLPYVDGEPADRADARHREAAATLLGRVHASAGDVAATQRPGAVPLSQLRPALDDGSYLARVGVRARPLPPPLAERAREIAAAREWALELIDRLAARRAPTTGLVHGDFFRGNVLVRGARPVALVDWEEARLDWQAGDLASAAWEFAKIEGGTRLDAARADDFVRAYRAAGGTVPAGEDDLLVPLIRVRRILEVLRAPHDRHVDWDYQLSNLDAFRNLG